MMFKTIYFEFYSGYTACLLVPVVFYFKDKNETTAARRER
jgi:hypothetical protein